MNRTATRTKIARLERRILKKAQNLFPKTPSQLHSALIGDLRLYFQDISPFEVFTRSRPVFYDLERYYAEITRDAWRERLAKEHRLSPDQRARIQNQWKHIGAVKIYRDLRPEFERLRREFMTELARINPQLAREHRRDDAGGPSRAELRRIRDSVWVAIVGHKVHTGPLASITERFKKRAMAVLPPRLADRFQERCVGKGVALPPPPPRCRDGVHSPYLPACRFPAPGDPRE